MLLSTVACAADGKDSDSAGSSSDLESSSASETAGTEKIEDKDTEKETKKETEKKTEKETSLVIPSVCKPLTEVPRFTAATYSATYPSGDGIQQLYYTGADASKITAYVNQLKTLGYVKTEDNSINGNRFVTCYGKGGLVHISYLNHNKSLSVILDELKNAVYKYDEPKYTKVTDQTLAVMSLDYDTHQDTLKDGNHDASGMSYVITLEDGRYVIIDGGYGGAADHHILYNYLKDNNKRKDKKIVIAAWIFTHDHSDHY